MTPKLYSTPEAAKAIGVTTRTIFRWIEDDKVKPQGRRIVPVNPPSYPCGDGVVMFWTEADLARARKVKAEQKPGPKVKS
jgi:hypothetical protein